MLWLTTGLLLQQLSLAVDDTEDQQGQQDGGQSAADNCGQGHVPRAGYHRGQRHQVDTAAACEEDRGRWMWVELNRMNVESESLRHNLLLKSCEKGWG